MDELFIQTLTIAGSDSGGGAGIQADLKTFQMRGVFGTSVLTAVTAQNTLGVSAVHPIPTDMIAAQIAAIQEDFQIAPIKSACWVRRKSSNAWRNKPPNAISANACWIRS